MTLLVLWSSGCGTISKMRYSNGFKSNFELNLRKKEESKATFKAAKAIKKQRPVNISRVAKILDSSENSQPPEFTSSEKNIDEINYNIGEKKTFYSLPSDIHQDSLIPEKQAKPPYEKNSKIALILFLISIPLMLIGIGTLLFIVSVALAIAGRKKILRSKTPMRGLTMDNVIIIIGLLILAAFIILGMFLLLYIFTY